jgi:acetyl esterase/lipase
VIILNTVSRCLVFLAAFASLLPTSTMVAHTSQEDLSGFGAFNVHNAVYKTIDSHNLDLDVIIPKDFTQPANGAPIILRYHGGGLITGSSLTPLFFPQHLLDLATKHSAIIVSPNYRLLPESTITDILDDTEDNWKWLHSSLGSFLQTIDAKFTPRLDQILVYGESAGGYLALQVGFDHPTSIRSLAIAYR